MLNPLSANNYILKPTEITIYTDGSALGNPGPGGYGVVMMSGPHRKEMSQGYRRTTNNRMELLAVIVALEHIRFDGCNVTVYSDSKYVVNAVEKGWLEQWVRKEFKDKKNADLWKRYLKAAARQNVRFVWVKGHAEIPENERCDRLATSAAASQNLLADEVYEALPED